MVIVDAKAGTGKTATCLAVVDHFKPYTGFYTAFNKSIVTEAQEKFPSNIECRTKHAFALRYVRPKNSIEDFTYLCITEDLSYPNKRLIMDTMEGFFLSNSTDMYDYVSRLEDTNLEATTLKYIQKMIDEKIPPTFNFLLKYLHIQLDQGLIEIEYDLAILDEAQDTTAVFFEIFKLIKAERKLIVGDPFQNIYGFMNTVNAFDLVDDSVPRLGLTKTFRCSTEIAKRVQTFGRKHLSSDFSYVGTDSDYKDGTIAYIGRTNASILMRIQELLEDDISFSLTRPVKEIFALPMALANIKAGRPVYHKKYKYLEKEFKNFTVSGSNSFYSYLIQYVEDEELHGCIGFMNMLREKKINIFTLKKDAENLQPSGATWIVTSHSFKGREVDTVIIEDSLNRSIEGIIEQGGPETQMDQEELNLYYVAATRARHTLLGAKYL